VAIAVAFVLLCAVVTFAAQQKDAIPVIPGQEYHVWNLHRHPWFWEVLASAVMGWLLSIVKGFAGTEGFYNHYFSNTPNGVIMLSDLICLVVAGAYFGTAIYNPQNVVAAIAAGLNWPVGLNALLGQRRKR